MDVYRTPEDRFRDLPGYPFAPDGVWVVEGAGHMLQEDRGEAIAERIVEWVNRTHA